MDIAIYGGARAPAKGVSEGQLVVNQRKSFFARFMDALRGSRAQQARRVIENSRALLPPNDPDSPI